MTTPLTFAEIHALYKGDTNDRSAGKEWYAKHGVEYDDLHRLGIWSSQWALTEHPDEPAVALSVMFVAGARLGLLIAGEVQRKRESDTIV